MFFLFTYWLLVLLCHYLWLLGCQFWLLNYYYWLLLITSCYFLSFLVPHFSNKVYIPIFKVLEQSWRPFTSLKLCMCSQKPQPASRVGSNSNKNYHFPIICKQSTHIKLHHHTRCWVGLRGRNSRNKNGTYLLGR